MKAKIVIKGEVELSKDDIKLLRQASPEAALTTLRAQGAVVEVSVEVSQIKIPGRK